MAGCGGGAPPPETADQVALGAPPTVAVDPTTDAGPLAVEPDDDRPSRCDVACEEDGLCAKMDGACVALEDAHCRGSKACREQGRCTAEERQCVKASNGDACDAFIAAMRACMAKMPPDAQQSLEASLEALENAVKSDDPETRRAMTQTCEGMTAKFAEGPLCQ